MSDRFRTLDREPVGVSSPNSSTWLVLGDLADAFPAGWVLIGGLMVYLLGAEAGQTPVRVTADADILVRVKVLTAGTREISKWLVDRGLGFEGANAFEQGHRFSAEGVSVDVLVPGGIGERAERRTVAENVAAEVVGGSALLQAGELVSVVLDDGHMMNVPRPRLDAAIVGKSKAATRLDSPQRHCQDLAFLFGLVVDPVEMAGTIAPKDRAVIADAMTAVTDQFAWSHANDEPAAQAAARILSQP
jgi:hypothetical protein